jgi:hypothetical protein
VNFALFGDPSVQGKGDTSLGWYAAYAKSGGNSPSQGNGKALAAAGPPALEPTGPPALTATGPAALEAARQDGTA